MRDIKSWLLTIILTIFLTGILGYQMGQLQAAEEVPLPKDINILPPSPDLPKEIASFSGKWAGAWWSQPPRVALLIVEEIDKQEAKIIYAFGPYRQSEAGYIRIKAKIIPGSPARIEFINPNTKSDFTFKMRKNLISLEAYFVYGRAQDRFSTVFERVD